MSLLPFGISGWFSLTIEAGNGDVLTERSTPANGGSYS